MKRTLGTALLFLGLAAPGFAADSKGNGQIGTFSVTDFTNFKYKKIAAGDECLSTIDASLPQSIKNVCAKKCQSSVRAEYGFQVCGQAATEAKPASGFKLTLAAGELFQLSGGPYLYAVQLDCTTGELKGSSLAPAYIFKNDVKDSLETKTEVLGSEQLQTSYDAGTKAFSMKLNSLVVADVPTSDLTIDEALKALTYGPLSLEINYAFDSSVKSSASDTTFPLTSNASMATSWSLGADKQSVRGDLHSDNDFTMMFLDAKTSTIDWASVDAFFTDLAKLQSAKKESKKSVTVEYSRSGRMGQNAKCMTLQ